MIVLSTLALFALLALAPRAQEDPPATAPSLPSSILPHCLYGFDPHDQAVQPWPKGPVPDGYRLAPSSTLHLLSQLGFQEGDVVHTVNGFDLGTAERHYQARRGTRDMQRCEWEGERGGGPLRVQVTIQPTLDPDLVLERDKEGLAVVLSRQAIWARLSNPYAFGRYPSMLAMAADDGVYAIDKGLVALMRDLGFEPLDHHREIAGMPLHGGRDVLAALELLLGEKKVRWRYSRRGEVHTRIFVLRGDVIQIRTVPAIQEPPELELPEDEGGEEG